MKRALSPIIPGSDDDDSSTGHMIKHVRLEDGIEAFTEVIDSETVTTEEVDTEGMTIVEEEDMVPVQDPPSFQNLIIQNMNIDEPLSTLKKLLESRLQCSLSGHEFYLQDCLPLEPGKSLVEQCVQGTGMVQINVEVKSQPGVSPKINIVDILKPADELEEEEEEATIDELKPPVPAVVQKLVHAASTSSSKTSAPANTKVVIPFSEESDNVTRWIVDSGFRREQDRLKIPYDPLHWNESHVRHWITWSIKQFSLKDVSVSSFNLTGAQLCELSHPAFSKYVPQDPGDLFWTHLELLRKCKFVAVVQQPTPHAITTITVSTSGKKLNRPKGPRTPRIGSYTSNRSGDEKIFGSPGNRTGNNGQIQLWQFLLELLTDKDCREIIQWVGDYGEFKLTNPEMVAQMWGQRKNKPSMNYEKLSRALRYYYDGDMISKSHGKRFVYKFVCDLKMLLGYSAGELNELVTDCAERKLQKMRDSIQNGLVKMGIDHTEGAYTIVEST